MKSLKFFSLFVLLFAGALWLASCGNSGHTHENGADHTETMDADAAKSGPEYTSAYVCPMHCKGSGSDQPGKCPVCGMDYVANTDHQGTPHDGPTEHDHDDHSDHEH